VAAGKLGFKTGEGFRRWTPQEMDALRRGLAEHLLASQRQREGS
jgi:3-hydroxybutyryl-CoA dehydrogenase